MDRATVAERMLRLVMPVEQAEAMVGDQMEAVPEAGHVRFWASFGWLLLAFSWRTVLGVVAAPIVAFYFAFWPWALVVAPTVQLHMQTGRMQDLAWQMRWSGCSLGVCMILTGQAAFALFRYGLRDDFARVNLLFGFLATTISYLIWLPHGRPVCLLMITGSLLFYGVTKRRRRALSVTALVFLVDWSIGWAMMAPRYYPASWRTPWLMLQLTLFLVPLVGAGLSVALHRWLLTADGETAGGEGSTLVERLLP